MIEVEEEIIRTIEEIDSTFSSINRTLRSIRGSVEKMDRSNQKMIRDLVPWTRFFSAELEDSTENEPLHSEGSQSIEEEPNFQNICVAGESPESMKFSSPGNPFIDSTSSEVLNKTFLGNLSARFHTSNAESASSSLVPMAEEKAFGPYEESESSDGILPFNPSMLPPVFRNEESLFLVYDLISRGLGITMEEIYKEIPGVPREKINIFVDLLTRKKFVGREGNKFRTA
ncbi:hypothetical protein M970_110390 [Encephalitozoon cuniculi EcunIII-L]|uniref:Uncharacterized protein n=1 Tax=Encephalitozoon cuniculi TaxID=6035 RepID=M1K7I2_ENCCN|nr:hypothetical protein ECU11_0420 [Encephalitozoon cuniculi]KMV64998.1 hypothetical protein M970_110390 [Encephalitozoon cuniculi EcunIII-L]UYI26240.1 hypothetical protein J0A71_01g00570 [Encephalitozoon cuniculi]